MNAPHIAAVAAATLAEGAGVQPEVAAFGEWDTANLGDRGIHQGVRDFLSACGCSTRSYGVSTLLPVQPEHGSGNVNGHSSTQRRMASLLGRSPAVKRTLRAVRQRVRMRALIEPLEPARAVLVGGGALLTDTNLHFPQSLLELARYARRSSKPLLCLGCSMEGEWSRQGERMMLEFLSACDVIAVRDDATAARLAPALGARPPVFGDFCLLESLALENGGRSRDWGEIAINVSQLSGRWEMAQERYEAALVALANRLAREMNHQRPGIRIFTTGVPEDARAAERVLSRIDAPGARLYLPENLAQLSAMLGTSALVVSTRLHAAILALAARVPVIGFSASPKIRDFLATLGIRRYFHGLEDWPQVADALATTDYDAIYAEQRRALAHAPLWTEQARIRNEIRSLCGVIPCT
jgi:polysaccharide pyruvyl transferase WcaK-like protein